MNPSLRERRMSGDPHFGQARLEPASIGIRLYPKNNTRLVFFRNPVYKGSMLQQVVRRGGMVAAVIFIAAYGWMALRGPQGLQALAEKHRQIRQLQEQNAAMVLENQRRKDHIQLLEESTSEQDMQIRKQLKLLRPGETTFILPDAPKEKDPAGQKPE
jgi:cell division protein FtsB